jgi:hypothetical protein
MEPDWVRQFHFAIARHVAMRTRLKAGGLSHLLLNFQQEVQIIIAYLVRLSSDIGECLANFPE